MQRWPEVQGGESHTYQPLTRIDDSHKESIESGIPLVTLNLLLEKVQLASSASSINIDFVIELFSHCTDFALMNDLSVIECEDIVDVFEKYITPSLLQIPSKYSLLEVYKKLREALSKQGEKSEKSRIRINRLQLKHAADIKEAVPDIPPQITLLDFKKYNLIYEAISNSLADARSLMHRSEGLEQFYTALECLIHLTLQGYQNISHKDQCKLFAESMQYCCIGLSLATEKENYDLSNRFSILIDIIFAHYFSLHTEQTQDTPQPYLMTVLFCSQSPNEQLEILNRMLNAADILLKHSTIIADNKYQKEHTWQLTLNKAVRFYNLIIQWGIKDKKFSDIGTKALSRVSIIASYRECVQELGLIMSAPPSLISWKKNSSMLKGYRKIAYNSLKNQPIGDTLAIVKQFNVERKRLIRSIFQECILFTGRELPFKYAVLILGSSARDEACPYSDLEYAFMVGKKGMREKHIIISEMVLGLVELSIYALGETPFDTILESQLRAGLQFDQNYVPYHNRRKYPKLDQLWGTPESLLSSTLSDLNLGNMMQGADLLFAKPNSENLYKNFRELLFKQLDTAGRGKLSNLIRGIGNIQSTTPFPETDTQINIKESLLELPVHLLNVLSLRNGLTEFSSINKLEKLKNMRIIDSLTYEMIRIHLMISLRLRYLAHLTTFEENEILSLQPPSSFLDKEMFTMLMALRKSVLPILHEVFKNPEKIREIKPQDYLAAIPCILTIANEYLNNGQLEEALKYYNIALMIYPEFSEHIIFPKNVNSDESKQLLPGEKHYQKGNKLFIQYNDERCLPHFKNAALKMYPPAYLKLLQIHSPDTDIVSGVPKDKTTAILCKGLVKEFFWWFQKHIQKDVDALFNMGHVYFELNNKELALICWQLAAKSGYLPAYFSLGYYYFKTDKSKAFQYFYHANNNCNQNNVKAALYYMGRCLYASGKHSTIKESYSFFSDAGYENYSPATLYLGHFYKYDNQSPEKALSCYMQAARQKNYQALIEVGCCHREGYGTEKNEKKAIAYFIQASDQNFTFTKERLKRNKSSDSELTVVERSDLVPSFQNLDPDKKQESINKMIDAIFKGDFAQVEQLISNGVIFSYPDQSGMYPLAAAIYSANIMMVNYVKEYLFGNDLHQQWLTVEIDRAIASIDIMQPSSLPPDSTFRSLGNWYYENRNKSWCKIYDDYCEMLTGCEWRYKKWEDRREIFKPISQDSELMQTAMFTFLMKLNKEKKLDEDFCNGKIGESSHRLYAPTYYIHNLVMTKIYKQLQELKDELKAKRQLQPIVPKHDHVTKSDIEGINKLGLLADTTQRSNENGSSHFQDSKYGHIDTFSRPN
jgi:TPR repeat protein